MALTVTATLPVLTATCLGATRNPQFGFMYTQPLDASGNVVAAVAATASYGSVLSIVATGTGTNNTADQTLAGQRGANIFLNISSVAATSTVRITVQSKDNVSGNYLNIYGPVSVDGLATNTTSFTQLQIYPGVVSVGTANLFMSNQNLGLTFRAVVSVTATASQGGAGTSYQVNVQGLV